jgi:hypothetical protein
MDVAGLRVSGTAGLCKTPEDDRNRPHATTQILPVRRAGSVIKGAATPRACGRNPRCSLRTEAAMKPYPPAHGPASTNARLDAPARRQFQGAAPHEPLFVERSPVRRPRRRRGCLRRVGGSLGLVAALATMQKRGAAGSGGLERSHSRGRMRPGPPTPALGFLAKARARSPRRWRSVVGDSGRPAVEAQANAFVATKRLSALHRASRALCRASDRQCSSPSRDRIGDDARVPQDPSGDREMSPLRSLASSTFSDRATRRRLSRRSLQSRTAGPKR